MLPGKVATDRSAAERKRSRLSLARLSLARLSLARLSLAHVPLAFLALAVAAAPAYAQQARGRDGRKQRDVASEMERRTRKIYREQGPAVASVRVITNAVTRPRLVLPGVTIAPPGGQRERIDASGFLVTTGGHVVTTSAALFDAALIEVHFSDGTVRDADLVGTDGPFQMAVLRTRAPDHAKPLCVPEHTRSAGPTTGWFFQASAGRPRVRYGRVQAAASSATSYDDYLTTSFSLQPGAAGGPLISADGKLMGMAVREVRHRADDGRDTPPMAPSTLFIRGIDVHAAVDQIVRFGRVRRALLGVFMEDDTNRIDQLVPGGAAHLAGLVEGDTVVRIEGAAVTSRADVTRALLRKAIGDTVVVELRRGDARIERPVELSDPILPPVPRVAPMPGAELQVAHVPDTDGQWTVTIMSVVEGSSLHRAGARGGDRLIRVDGRDALRFLQRHRIRPADAFPRKIEIEREGTRHSLTFGE